MLGYRRGNSSKIRYLAAAVLMKYFAIFVVSFVLLTPVFSQERSQKTSNGSTLAKKKPASKPGSAKAGSKNTQTATAKRSGSADRGNVSKVKKGTSTGNTASRSSATGTKTGTSSKAGQTDKNLTARKTQASAKGPQKLKKDVGSKTASTKSVEGSVSKSTQRSTGAARTKQIASTAAGSKPKKNPVSKGAASNTKQDESADVVPDGKAEYEAAAAIADTDERIAALRRFVAGFPGSPFQAAAGDTITKAMVETGNNALRDRDVKSAAAAFLQAAKDAPVPIADELFTNSLSKLPVNLYFRGDTETALLVARIIEGKCRSNADQLLSLAEFYVSIENGSEAKRLAQAAIELAPEKGNGYQMRGLANRIDFQLDDAAADYARAVELDPESVPAMIGLAEMKRALGKPDESIELYRKVLAKDPANSSAKTGLSLALFESGKREDAESQMAAVLDENPRNLMLLAGAAYWYAAHDEGQKAVDLANRAISADPRFIWSHLALARGYIALQRPMDAEKALLVARRYGNFPTMDYEIASARLRAGFYREAAEALSQSYWIQNGEISTKLGGRVPKGSADISELVGLERKASIAEPQSAESAETSAQLQALLDLWTKLNSEKPDQAALGKAVDAFVRGGDVMRTHRLIFAAKELLDRKKDLSKVLELTKEATGSAETAVDIPNPSSAVMADELYESRRLAALKDQYIAVPDVSRSTLVSIIRGRIEEISGWTLFQLDNSAESIVRLKRAVSVLPTDSAWWRTSVWRLGTVLESRGQDQDALDSYTRSYQSGQPDAFKYSVIAAVYKRVNGSTFGLDKLIGPNPSAPNAEATAQNIEPPAIPSVLTGSTQARPSEAVPVPIASPSNVPVSNSGTTSTEVLPSPSPTAESVTTIVEPSPTPTVVPTDASPAAATTTAAKDEAKPTPSPTQDRPAQTAELPSVTGSEVKEKPASVPSSSTESIAESAKPTTQVKAEPSPEPSPAVKDDQSTLSNAAASPKAEPSPSPTADASKPETSPETQKTDPKPEPTGTPGTAQAVVSEKPSSETRDQAKPVSEVKPTDGNRPDGLKQANSTETDSNAASTKTIDNGSLAKVRENKELFPSTIITVPPADVVRKPVTAKDNEKPASAEIPTTENVKIDESKPAETKPEVSNPDQSGVNARPRIVPGAPIGPSCALTLSNDTISLENNEGKFDVIVRAEDERDISALTATSSSPSDVYVRVEPTAGMTGRAHYVIRSISKNRGIFQVTFALPCGFKNLVVNVR